jgi:hypothetical protein
MAPITARLGNRSESATIVASFSRDFMLPPFYITTETRSVASPTPGRKAFGHYMTNWGASLSSIMFGMSGLQLGSLSSDPTSWGGSRVGTLPLGWDRISFTAWLGGKRYHVVARHGVAPQITPVEITGASDLWRSTWRQRKHKDL